MERRRSKHKVVPGAWMHWGQSNRQVACWSKQRYTQNIPGAFLMLDRDAGQRRNAVGLGEMLGLDIRPGCGFEMLDRETGPRRRKECIQMTSCSDFDVRFVKSDSSDLALLISALSEELAERYPGPDSDDLPPLHGLLAAVVAYRGNVPVGCSALCELEPGVGEIKRVFVVPEARRLGIARRMLGVLEDRAHELGYSAVRLGTGFRQPEAIALYESSGYRRIPLFGEYAAWGDSCTCYEKTLE